MCLSPESSADAAVILSHRYDNGADFWATPDGRLLKGAPFTTLESAGYLLELGVPADDPVLQGTAELVFSHWKPDGRIPTTPGAAAYPCHTALAANLLCRMGYAGDVRLQQTFAYFMASQQPDGGWKCNKYSFGRGEETRCSTPYTTLQVLDLMRHAPCFGDPRLDRAVDFLLEHWVIRRPISPCHYGIGTRFLQPEYPFRGYDLFYYVYVLSFYPAARQDPRFGQAVQALADKTVGGQMVVERVVPKLAKLNFCRKGHPSAPATRRWQEICRNLAT